MKNSGFTIIEVMVSLLVVLLIAAGTTAVISYLSGLSTYQIKAANAQQAVETALLLVRNDLLQAGGPSGAAWSNNQLFIKYNGFINFENPASRSAWQTVDTSGSFIINNFPLLVRYDIPNKRTAFMGILYLSSDVCDESPTSCVLQEVTEKTQTTDNLTHSLEFKTSSSLLPKTSRASPAIVYEFVPAKDKTPGTLLRNGLTILGGSNSDISVTSFSSSKPSEDKTATPVISSWSVYLQYDWTPPFSSPSPFSKRGFQKIPANQSVSVGKVRCLMRVGG